MNRSSAVFACVAGVLIGVGGAPLEASFLSLLAPGALAIAITPRRGLPLGNRAALAAGALTGFVANLYSMYWVVGLLETFGGFPTVAAVPTGALLWAGQALPYAIATLLACALIRHRVASWIALPLTLTVASSLAPALFPWRFGLSQLPFLPFAQVAEIGGLPLLDWLVASIGVGSIEALRVRRWQPAAVALAAFVLPTIYGLIRIPQVEDATARAPALRVGVVQPNIGVRAKHDIRRHVAQLALLRRMTKALEDEGAQLVVWPESSYPFPLHRDELEDRGAPLGVIADGVHGPVLAGVITTDGAAQIAVAIDGEGREVAAFRIGRGDRYNSAVAIERGGAIVGIADKVRLLAFGEYTPLWDVVPLLHVFPRGLRAGEGPQLVALAGARIGVLNCYEDLLADYVQAQARHAPAFWANVTNNAWFGNTTAPHLHHMNARLRAIETRRELVRAVNTGPSGHTRATGVDSVRTGAFVRGRFVAEVRLLDGTTFWVRYGDCVTPACLGALAGLLLAARRRRVPSRAPT